MEERSNELVPEIRPQKEGNRDETGCDAGEPELRFRKNRKVWVKKSDGLKGVRAGPLDLRVRRIRGHQNMWPGSLEKRKYAKVSIF